MSRILYPITLKITQPNNMKFNLTKSVVALCASSSLTAIAIVTPDANISIINKDKSCCCETARPDAHAPLGVMGDHVHKKGEWMASYRFMTMSMQQIYQGSDTVPSSMAGTGHMMSPREMTMDMHMLGLMYAPTDKVTLMLMSSYKENSMPMAGPTGAPTMKMKSSGVGDTSIGGLYQFHKTETTNALFGLSVSLPTGSIDKKVANAPNPMAIGRDLPFPMQLGSGTYDFTPSVTYNQLLNAQWSWGAQAKATIHTGTNDAGYTLGDSINMTSWVARNLNSRFSVSGRANFRAWSGVDGTQTNGLDALNPNLSSPADPNSTGGSRVDLYLGLNYIHCSGVRLAGEIGKSVYQDLQGTQLGNDWSANFGIQYAW